MIEQYRPVILGETLRVLNGHPALEDQAEDVVQDVLVKLTEEGDKISEAGNPKAYIRSCTRHTARRSVAKLLGAPTPIRI